MTHYPHWILDRSFGGSLVADAPGSQVKSSNWPIGRSTPAARECCDLLINCCNESSDDLSTLVFLIGGAGNGKSFLANYVTNEIEGIRTSDTGFFASRAYDYELANGRYLKVVNDATIPSQEDKANSGDLLKDIAIVFAKKGNLLACVNRGILLNEANNPNIDDTGDQNIKLSVDIVKWLLGGGSEIQTNSGFTITEISNQLGYYAFCCIEQDGTKLGYIHVAFMDHVSLFEPNPDNVSHTDKVTSKPLLLEQQAMTPILSGDRSDPSIPTTQLLLEFFTKLNEIDKEGLPGGSLDPFGANLESLSSPKSVSSLCSVMRGAEVISGNHFTYRDIWGCAVLASLGSLPISELAQYESWVKERANIVRDSNENVTVRLQAVIDLCLRRISSAVFSGQGPISITSGKSEQPKYPSVQAIESLANADPLIGLDETVKKEVLDKLSLLEENRGPGQSLANEDEDFSRFWTDLDYELESILLEWLQNDEEDIKFSERNQVLSWYGQYLFRLYSLSKGYPAYPQIVDRWQNAWIEAKNSTPKHDITQGLNRLVFLPFDEADAATYLPLFSPKVEPVSKSTDGARTSIRVQSRHYEWSIRRDGDSLILMLSNHKLGSEKMAEIIMDFSLIRECMAQIEGEGFTECAEDVEPRLERLRAEILSMEILESERQEQPPQIVFVEGETLIHT